MSAWGTEGALFSDPNHMQKEENNPGNLTNGAFLPNLVGNVNYNAWGGETGHTDYVEGGNLYENEGVYENDAENYFLFESLHNMQEMEYGPQCRMGDGSPTGFVYGLRGTYGPFYGMGGSYDSTYRPHTELGVVVNLQVPYSFTFPSNLGYGSSTFRVMDDKNDEINSLLAPSSPPNTPTQKSPESQSIWENLSPESVKIFFPGRCPENEPAFNTGGGERKMEVTLSELNELESIVWASQPPEKEADTRIKTVVLVEKDEDPNAGKTALKVDGNTVTLKDIKYTPDEVITTDGEGNKEIQSNLVSNMVDGFLLGHNAALLVSWDARAPTAPDRLVLSTLKLIVARLEAQEKSADKQVSMSLTLDSLQGNNVRDLLSSNTPKIAGAEILFGHSPILGSIVLDTTAVDIKTAEDCEKHMKTANDKRTDVDRLILGTLLLRQWDKKENDVLLSSLTIAISANGAIPFVDVVRKCAATNAEPFLFAINGPCISVHALCIYETNIICEEMLRHAEEIGKMVNKSPHSGSVRHFIEAVEAHQTELTKKAEESNTSSQGFACFLENVIKDLKKLLEEPENTNTLVFRVMRE
ncbi:hypothetical protein MOQ_009544 [Trypanosoma cruzi marinkellei]|uniref:Uncharacterized protein n=1 Tax=Trypanosoma cruzi marinkellei TaxID=85056 RepID=K2MWJ4_TRYCR|nr:hypothetical protein MOQ_009544 [Trypanosoma cruzi marinkellei]